MNAIETKNITKQYKGFCLRDISICVPRGTIVGLVGENGSGKSTLINAVLDIIDIDSGEVKVFGKSNKDRDFKDRKQQIGVVVDSAEFPEVLNVRQVEKIMKNTFSHFDVEYYYMLIDRFKLPHDKKISEFSRGMKAKLAITASMSHHPKLLILDEATVGLDPLIRDEVLNLLHEFTRDEDNSILISSHIVSDLEKICDYIVCLHQGKLILFEEKDLILEKYGILKTTKDEMVNIAEDAIIKQNDTKFGVALLVLKEKLPSVYQVEFSTLEDIIIMLVKEEMK